MGSLITLHTQPSHIACIEISTHNRLTFSFAYRAIFRISAIFTTFVAASSRSSVRKRLKPESEMICLASSMFVPFIRSTIGFFMPVSMMPLIRPRAMMSALAIPAKMFTRMLSTLGSLSMILSAATTCSSVALPPTSRKLAGRPFLVEMRSMVAMANPAPLTMHPILPSRVIQFKSYLSAYTSFQFFCDKSSSMKISFCRKRELSSMLILLSQISSFPSMDTPSGLISSRVASDSMKHLYSLGSSSLACRDKSSDSSKLSVASSRVLEGILSPGGKKNLCTLLCSTSSMLIPPLEEVTIAMDPVPLSNKKDTQSSLLRNAFSTRKTSFTFLPEAPV